MLDTTLVAQALVDDCVSHWGHSDSLDDDPLLPVVHEKHGAVFVARGADLPRDARVVHDPLPPQVLVNAFDLLIEREDPLFLRFVRDRVEVVKGALDRKSTRLNSSHVKISYAVFCLTKKRSR